MVFSTGIEQEEDADGLEASLSDKEVESSALKIVTNSPEFNDHVNREHGGKKPQLKIASEEQEKTKTLVPGVSYGANKHGGLDAIYGSQHKELGASCECGKKFEVRGGTVYLETRGPSMLEENRNPINGYTGPSNTFSNGPTLLYTNSKSGTKDLAYKR